MGTFVQFSNLRVVEYTDFPAFHARVHRWLAIREAENANFLHELAALLAQPPQSPSPRAFLVTDGDALAGAGILFPGGCLLTTWMSHDALTAVVNQLSPAQWPIATVYAPSHISWLFAEAWAARTGQRMQIDRAERIYQLARPSYPLPDNGRLELATTDDLPTLHPWLDAFISEAQFELGGRTPAMLLDGLLSSRGLYLWKTSAPVSMAAIVAPTPNGLSINFVYTPPEHRRQGHAKAVVAALAAHVLANHRKFCFIFADTTDHQKHKLYQQIGARTVCEFVRCTLLPPTAAPVIDPLRPNFSFVQAS